MATYSRGDPIITIATTLQKEPTEAPALDGDVGSSRFNESLIKAATILSLSAVVAIVLVSFYRLGLTDSLFLKFSVLSYVLAALWLPVLAIGLRLKERWLTLGFTLAMIVGLTLPLLGLLLGAYSLFVCGGIIAVALASVRAHMVAILSTRKWVTVALAGIGLGLGMLLSGDGSRYQLPETLSLGLAHSDNYFHIAITQMIINFGVPSIGADGLEFQRYHFGSHLVAAGIAGTSHASAPLVYVYWGALALKIQLLWALIFCALMIARKSRTELPLAPAIGYIIVYLLVGRGFAESESFMLALTLLVAAIPMASSLVARQDPGSDTYRWEVCTLIVVAILCAVTKVSVGYFCGVILLWVMWSRRDCRVNFYGIAAALLALAIFTFRYLIPKELSLIDAGYQVLYDSYLQYFTFATLVTYVAAGLIVFWNASDASYRATPAAHGGVHEVRHTLSLRVFPGIRAFYLNFLQKDGFVQILALCLLACLLVLFTVPIGSNVGYFSGVVLFLVACRVPNWFSEKYTLLTQQKRQLALLLLAVLALLVILEIVRFANDFARSSSVLIRSEARQAALGASGDLGQGRKAARALRQIGGSYRDAGTMFPGLQEQIARTPWAGMLEEIAKLRDDGRKPGVYVRPATVDFWERLKGGSPYWCMSAHLMIPAELGVPLIQGIGPEKLEKTCMPPGIIWYGFGKQQHQHRVKDMTDQDICAAARRHRFGSIYIVNSIWQRQANQVLVC